MTALDLSRVRQAVADELEACGLGNRTFIEEVRAGKRDDSPYMVGAIAWARAAMRMKADALD